MDNMIRSKLIRVGNSQGIRIPRILIEQAGLQDEVDLLVQGDKLIIQAVHQPRQGWRARFAVMAERGDDQLVDQDLAT